MRIFLDFLLYSINLVWSLFLCFLYLIYFLYFKELTKE